MKRYVSVFMGIVLFWVFVAYGVGNGRLEAAASEPTQIRYGDVDQSGEITIEDVQLSLRSVLKIETLPEEARAAMDVDGNNRLDLTDALLILQRALRVIDRFPAEDGGEATEQPPATDIPDVTEPPVPTEPGEDGGKTLIVYFSWSSSGNTERMANTIQKYTEGTVYEIVPLTPYPENYTRCTEVALEERDNNARPAIKEPLASLDEYDRIFIGYPKL